MARAKHCIVCGRQIPTNSGSNLCYRETCRKRLHIETIKNDYRTKQGLKPIVLTPRTKIWGGPVQEERPFTKAKCPCCGTLFRDAAEMGRHLGVRE